MKQLIILLCIANLVVDFSAIVLGVVAKNYTLSIASLANFVCIIYALKKTKN